LKRYKTQLEWEGSAENEISIVSAIDNSVIFTRRNENEGGADEVMQQSHSTNFTTGVNSNIPDFQNSNFPFVSVGDTVIAIDPNYYRPTEVDLLIGDASKAKEKLGWVAETDLNSLVKIMVESDLKKVIEKGY